MRRAYMGQANVFTVFSQRPTAEGRGLSLRKLARAASSGKAARCLVRAGRLSALGVPPTNRDGFHKSGFTSRQDGVAFAYVGHLVRPPNDMD